MAVGSFPAGASPYGCLDMSGNVWEWCRTKWQWPEGYEDYEDDDDLTESPRVMRGGSFNWDQNECRCAARGWSDPYLGRNLGFRVAAFPFTSGL